MSLADSFGRSGFARFINSPSGRVLRIVAGVGLIAWGYSLLGSAMGVVLIVVGCAPLAAGIFNLCLISALLGGPISGRQLSSRQ